MAGVFPEASRTGGVERVVWDVLSHLRGRADTVFVGTRAVALPADVAHAAVRPGRGLPGLRPLAFRRAARPVVRGVGADLTLTFGVQCPPGDVLWVGSVHRAWLEAARTVPVGPVDVPAGVRFLMPHHRALLALERQYFTRSSPRHVFCTSQREVDDLVRLYDVPRSVLRVVPNGFDPALFDAATAAGRRAAERARLEVRDDDVVLLFLANELHRKGYGQVLEAMAALRDPRLRLHLVGRAAPTAYAARTAALGLAPQVHYLGPTDDVLGHLAAADLLVLPSQYEPFGLVVVEALAAGLPVLVSARTGAAEAVTHDVHGLVQQDPYDVDELVEHLRSALDADRRQRWASAAPAAAAPYAWPNVLGRVEQLLL